MKICIIIIAIFVGFFFYFTFWSSTKSKSLIPSKKENSGSSTISSNKHEPLTGESNSKPAKSLNQITEEELLTIVRADPSDRKKNLKLVFDHILELSKTSQKDSIEFTLKLPKGVFKNSGLGCLAKHIDTYPNDKFLPLLDKLTEPSQYKAVFSGLFTQLDATPDKMVKINWYLENIKNEDQLKQILWNVSNTVFTEGFEVGKVWLLSLDDKYAQEADRRIIRDLGITKPQEAIILLQEFINNDKFQRFDSVASQFVESYRQVEPIKCLEWTWQLPNDDIPTKPELIDKAISYLYARNPEQAENYFQSLKDPELKALISKKCADARKRNGYQ